MTVEDAQIGGAEFTADSRVRRGMWGQREEDTPVYAVVSAVADVTGDDPCDLPPLARVIDPDALNALFSSDSASEDTVVRFQYVGHTVVVTGAGDVEVLTEAEKEE
ncbi:HalOD1 output domain-containing protein [Natronobacterium haloterrestre]|nr:HalOD1 output domain-containing protein [Halobiforma haloterrestris]